VRQRSSKLDYRGRRVLITGCDTGFGRLAALRLHALGAKVIAACLTEQAVRQFQQEGMLAVQMDVTVDQSVETAVQMVKEIAGDALDCLINNAGIMLGSVTELTHIDIYKKTMDVNFLGAVRVTKAFLPMVKKSTALPRIVNIASIAGRISCHSFGAYSASKFACEAFTIALRQEMKEWNISVAMIEPGFHGTALLPLYTANLKKCFSQSNPEMQVQYGEKYVEQQIKSFDWMKSICSGDPANVIAQMVDCAGLKRVKDRYVIGFDAKYLHAPMTFVPDWLYDMVFALLARVNPAAMLYNEKREVSHKASFQQAS
jgi:NAD(P)-dependent dehydrogenase (short-subunit alcohol dehydrogenase family)